jgi:trans-2,3-dihydro-3-hydroxyanthranilate isomerase
MPTEPSHPYEILDVFTDTPLEGNSLAVFTAGEDVPSRLMQRTAREMNLSETVFLLPGDGEADAHVRIFTPAAEMPFAGHPILGSAFVVGALTHLDVVRLRTAAGTVPVYLTREDDEITFGEMEQPIPTVEPFPDPEALRAALGIAEAALPIEAYTNGPTHVMIALHDALEVAALTPDIGALQAFGEKGFSCFALDEDGMHVKTRMFAPGLGVPEDPATGSAAGPLALHLVRHGRTKFGQTLLITQGVEVGRPSELHATVEGTAEAIDRIVVGGSAVRVASGHYRLQ